MLPSPKHLQTNEPATTWEDWYAELCKLAAKEWKIDPLAAARHVNIAEARLWYLDGFAPYVTFRENFEIS